MATARGEVLERNVPLGGMAPKWDEPEAGRGVRGLGSRTVIRVRVLLAASLLTSLRGEATIWG